MSDRPDHGDAVAEYRAARAGRGLAPAVSEVVWATGPDAVTFLDGQLSQDVVAMEPGTVARSFLLEPRGKLISIMWVLRGEERIGLVVDAGQAETVARRLEEFRFRVDVEFEADEREVHELWGRGAAAFAAEAGLDPGPGWVEEDGRLVALLRGRVLDRVLVAGDPEPLRRAGARPVGRLALSPVRIEAGEPEMGVDVDESTIPQESGLVPEAVSFTKGCFVGQELVARIDSRGRVTKRLAGLVLRTNVIPPVGSTVVADGEEVGELSRVGESLALRAPVAFAVVRHTVEDGDAVEIRWDGGSAPAVLRELPLDDFSDPPNGSLTDGGERDGDEASGGA
ncbi:MAG: glycine cleavage T C-terminal barrel domain-containing protein [Acidimicrobiia bacterium]|nr:glycine cleavage T C-terminal barrel domain-containing protein [Acidimicrobiia bacterium]